MDKRRKKLNKITKKITKIYCETKNFINTELFFNVEMLVTIAKKKT